LGATLETLSRKSDTAAAILCALNRRESFVRYVVDGCIEIDNSAAERALRGVALGRRNYLFAGGDSGGERAAVMVTLIGAATLNCVKPETYLRTYSRTLPSIRSTRSARCCLGTWHVCCPLSLLLHRPPQPSRTALSRRLRCAFLPGCCS
jgi:hypothetical protein